MADGRSRSLMDPRKDFDFTLQKLLSTEVTCLTWVFNSFYLFIYLFIYLLAVLSLH